MMCEIHQLVASHPQLGPWPTTQACALTRNQTSDLLVHRPALNPLSHTSQGNLWHFNYMSWCVPLWVQLVWDSVLPEIVCLFSFTKLGKFSFISFPNKFSVSCSSSSIPMIWMSVRLQISQRLLILSLIFLILLSSCCFIECFFLPWVPNH